MIELTVELTVYFLQIFPVMITTPVLMTENGTE